MASKQDSDKVQDGSIDESSVPEPPEDEQPEAKPANADAPESLQPGQPLDQDSGEAAAGEGEGDLEQELLQARMEANRLNEAMLRMKADLDNERRRMERELDKSRRFALEKVMGDLLSVRDNLERGLDAFDSQGSSVEQLREGSELTLKELDKVLQRHGIEEIDPLGERFDPEKHEALTAQPSEEQEPDTVLEVIQKGYKLHERLLRPARVIVAKEPPAA